MGDQKQIVILGGAGKMGRGIALVMLQELPYEGKFLTLVDVDASLFQGVDAYLRTHMRKHPLGEAACDKVRYVTSLEGYRYADYVFEAVIEDINLKAKVLKNTAAIMGPDTIFFSNTSSIPIHLLASLSRLTDRLVGFHFYNPPPVQKVIELIIPEDVPDSLISLAKEMVVKLHKTAVHSSDIAGFIGNGHFIREIIFAAEMVERLTKQMSEPQAMVVVNKLYQEWLLRPMGIFQLVDYVGMDICVAIMKIMKKYVPDDLLQCPLLEKLLAQGILGGQNPDGTQKPGIFEYAEGVPMSVYSLELQKYNPYEESFLGECPAAEMTWRLLVKDPEKSKKVDKYFSKLQTETSVGAKLATELYLQSKLIAKYLVDTGVAKKIADVDTILQQGFYHLGSLQKTIAR